MCRIIAAGEEDQRHHQPGLRMRRQKRIVRRHHHQQHRQRQVVVVESSAACRSCRISPPAPRRARTAPTIFFWFGMITTNTLNAMMVPMKAPTWMKRAAAGKHLGVEHRASRISSEHRRSRAASCRSPDRRAAQAVIEHPADQQTRRSKSRSPATARAASPTDRSGRRWHGNNTGRSAGRSRSPR